ncbi:sigma-54-dependent transcriptional regulator [Oceanisphaera arctica]|uniref:Sigma-54-dependent Fis family transcriptional regulator n=1 Tax=Oceanisphaera arctica TaxID=641510 RepID=A0A2P5TPY5_9GAMM|nr:sigma-54 dependent transcriptional regulator [Oceanisphaera arctica]PPL17747.1 sigma-54-dependent Fis family transcriptional regulator [Oceanisphaera arctica]GHA18210.1 sigma-54-dependent Fis family transcriptional regulator [Oceanisphaera arctica]
MVDERLNVLLVEDTASLAALYQAYLQDEPLSLTVVSNGQKALEHIRRQPPDILLLDLILPDMPGMEILQWLHREQPNVTTIVITAHGSVDVAVDAMRLGAHDFINKPVEAERLKVTLHNTMKFRQLNQLVDRYRHEIEREPFQGFIGASLPMQKVYRLIENAAPSTATVFVTGESGTGKEVCAEALHQLSGRSEGPFIALNCAAIPKDLMESELFGHIKGAFTGALQDRDGAVIRADGGTLFMDEICEMDLELQSKLLRFLQSGLIQPVGSSQQIKVDVRIVCATNRDPLVEVEQGRFREDLYYRLHVIPIHLPPLRERGGDVISIANALVRQASREENKSFVGLSEATKDRLQGYHWPGNVRQLQNVIRNAVVLHQGEWIEQEMLPAPLDTPHAQSSTAQRVTDAMPAPIVPLSVIERQAIERAISHCQGNVSRAAALLEVSPSTIYRKLQSWDNN